MSELSDKIVKSAGIGYLGNVAITIWGETLQGLAAQGKVDHSWLSGHLSDFGLAGQAAAAAMLLGAALEKRYLGLAAAALVPVALTVQEYYPIISPKENFFDVQDIALYWLATGITIAGVMKYSGFGKRKL